MRVFRHSIFGELLKLKGLPLVYLSPMALGLGLAILLLSQAFGLLPSYTGVFPASSYWLGLCYPVVSVLQAWLMVKQEQKSGAWALMPITVSTQVMVKMVLLLLLISLSFIWAEVFYALSMFATHSCTVVFGDALSLIWPKWNSMLYLWLCCLNLGCLHYWIAMRYPQSFWPQIVIPIVLLPLGAFTPYAFLLIWWEKFGYWKALVPTPLDWAKPLVSLLIIYFTGILTFKKQQLWNTR